MNIRMIVLLLLASITLPTFAAESALDAEIEALRAYCKPDVERLCPNVPPGGGQIKACLMAQQNELTVGCAKALQELKNMKKAH